MRETITALGQEITIQRACAVMAYPHSSYYRQERVDVDGDDGEKQVRQPSPRALGKEERESVRETLNSVMIRG